MAKKNSIISTDVTENVIAFKVADVGSFEVDVSALAESVREKALFHGLVQKVSDAAALPKGATPSDKFEAMKAVAERLIEGDWRKTRGEGAGPVAGIIFRAFAQWAEEMAKAKKAKAPDREKLRAVYDAKPRSDQLALRNVPRIAEIIAEMKAANEKPSTVDTGGLLAEIGL